MPSVKQRSLLLCGACASAVVIAPSCRDPEEIVVDLTTNVPCDAVAEVAVAVASTPLYANTDVASPYGPITRSSACKDGVLGRLVIAKSAAAQAAIVAVLTYKHGAGARECMNGSSGDCVIARRRVAFVNGTVLPLRIALIAECKGVACDVLTTCRDAGRSCYDAAVTCTADSCTEPGARTAGVSSPDAATASDARAEDASDSSDGGLTDGPSRSDGGLTSMIRCGSAGTCASPPYCCLRSGAASGCVARPGTCNRAMELLLLCHSSAECPPDMPFCLLHEDINGFASAYCSMIHTGDPTVCTSMADCADRPAAMCLPRQTPDVGEPIGVCQ